MFSISVPNSFAGLMLFIDPERWGIGKLTSPVTAIKSGFAYFIRSSTAVSAFLSVFFVHIQPPKWTSVICKILKSFPFFSLEQ